MDIFPMLIILAVGVTSWMAATGFRGRTTIGESTKYSE